MEEKCHQEEESQVVGTKGKTLLIQAELATGGYKN